jgi:hypothetical protein
MNRPFLVGSVLLLINIILILGVIFDFLGPFQDIVDIYVLFFSLFFSLLSLITIVISFYYSRLTEKKIKFIGGLIGLINPFVFILILLLLDQYPFNGLFFFLLVSFIINVFGVVISIMGLLKLSEPAKKVYYLVLLVMCTSFYFINYLKYIEIYLFADSSWMF